MQKMGLNEIREKYLEFFESKQHLRLPSFSLVPENDESLLIINAGMAPLKDYFTGQRIPPSKRVTTCQKCVRTGDIENVGKTARHGTFFEMLGNFSFGDYFKGEIIPWAWEFITEVLQVPKDRLWVTVYEDDDEAKAIWIEKAGVPADRIVKLGKEDNFWEVGSGVGPCGPCSEIYYDRGEEYGCESPTCGVGCDCDRYVEFWNLVFTQFDQQKDGSYKKLEHPNIDTGMGLERIATIMQEKDNIFEVDTMTNILNEVSKISGVRYKDSANTDISMRIITDHVRSVTFMISDGILPSNEGRGYVLRRLLRRAARHGKLIGIEKAFLTDICSIVIRDSSGAYPELKEKEDYIKKVIALEEERFRETIDSGMDILRTFIDEIKQKNEKILSGERAFKLYDTYGFPLELTEEILEEKDMRVDTKEFDKQMEAQRQRARSARGESNYMGAENGAIDKIDNSIVTEFLGYDVLEISSKVNIIIKDKDFVNSIKTGDKAIIVTDKTPFYAEMGGQVGDTGIIYNDSFKGEIVDCKKNISGKILHFIEVTNGELDCGDTITLKVDFERRKNICKNHTATHMLDEALREVIGEHVHQAGSYVSDERLRFDFTHFSALTEEEIQKVETLVNKKIMEVYSVETNIMSLEEAKESGAIALFDEKYSDNVRVVKIGEFSKELCGGTHVSNAGEIGLFKIVSESGVASGIRRIEAITGINAIKYIDNKNDLLKNIESILKSSDKDIIQKLKLQQNELKEKEKEISALKAKLASSSEDDILKSNFLINNVKVVAASLNDVDAEALRDLADKIRNKMQSGVVVLGSTTKDKVQFVAMATKDVVQNGIHCGKIIKEVASIAGGGGGGRPDMAQAGGRLPEKIEEAIGNVKTIVEKLVK